MSKYVLFDRDGTIIVEPEDERVDTEKKIKLFDDSISALKRLADAGYSIVLITNQAGIAEGRITVEDFERINGKVIDLFSEGGVPIAKTFMCPHGPEDKCDCRKPKPKMIIDAAKEFDFDVSHVFMVGDRPTDIEVGINAGTRTILVETALHSVVVPEAEVSLPNLTTVVDYILAQ